MKHLDLLAIAGVTPNETILYGPTLRRIVGDDWKPMKLPMPEPKTVSLLGNWRDVDVSKASK